MCEAIWKPWKISSSRQNGDDQNLQYCQTSGEFTTFSPLVFPWHELSATWSLEVGISGLKESWKKPFSCLRKEEERELLIAESGKTLHFSVHSPGHKQSHAGSRSEGSWSPQGPKLWERDLSTQPGEAVVPGVLRGQEALCLASLSSLPSLEPPDAGTSVWLSRVTKASFLSGESKKEAPGNQKAGGVHRGIRAKRSSYTCLNSDNEHFFSFSLLVRGKKYDSEGKCPCYFTFFIRWNFESTSQLSLNYPTNSMWDHFNY